MKFQKQQMMAIYRAEQMTYALGEICATLDAARLPFIPLKGAEIRKYYPATWMRTSCDIDVLVHEEDLDATIEVLQKERGYTLKGPRNYHDVSLFSASGVHLELHFHIRENMESIDRLLSRVWEYAKPIDASSCQYCLSNEYFAFYLLAHMAYHFVTGGCGVRPFMDLWLWRHKVGFDEAELKKMCEICDLGAFSEAMTTLSEVWFSGVEADALSTNVQAFILQGGVYGSMNNKISVQQNKKGGKLKYILSRLFLPYETLQYYYPILRRHKWMLPICEVRRWFQFLFKKRMKSTAQELSANQSLSKEQSEAAANLLCQLGL